jgi:hypothetical protein
MNMKLPTAATSRAAAPTIVHSTLNSMSGLRSLRLNTRISPVILRQCNPASLTCRERGVIHCNRPLIDYYKSARIVHPVRPRLGKCTMALHPPMISSIPEIDVTTTALFEIQSDLLSDAKRVMGRAIHVFITRAACISRTSSTPGYGTLSTVTWVLMRIPGEFWHHAYSLIPFPLSGGRIGQSR